MSAARLALAIGALASLSACSADEPSPPPAASDDGSAVIVTTTTAATTTPAGSVNAGSADTVETVPGSSGSSPFPPAVASELIGEFDQPVDLVQRAGDDSLFIVEQAGRIRRFDGASTTTVLDISDRVTGGNEQGLLGLAFGPDSGLAYVDFTDRAGDTVIAEFAVGADGVFDVASERLVLAVDQPFSNHNAGDLEFGPDGHLYITLGDGGSGGDPERNGSDPTTLLGSLLRIDPTPTGDAPYGIPDDNPFVDGSFDGVAGAPEVWSWGLRNPWKIAFDPVTGDLWIPDVGQNRFEEVNLARATGGLDAGRGVDFGWSAFEGTQRFNDDVSDTGRSQPPVLTYEHGDDGCSVSGGVPYRGSTIAGLEPAFVYSDFCSGIVWALDLADGSNRTLLTGFEGVTAIRGDAFGELYVLEIGGGVHRLVPD